MIIYLFPSHFLTVHKSSFDWLLVYICSFLLRLSTTILNLTLIKFFIFFAFPHSFVRSFSQWCWVFLRLGFPKYKSFGFLLYFFRFPLFSLETIFNSRSKQWLLLKEVLTDLPSKHRAHFHFLQAQLLKLYCIRICQGNLFVVIHHLSGKPPLGFGLDVGGVVFQNSSADTVFQ